MVILAAVLLFSWGALTGGFGAYALVAAFESESLFHAVQAGIALLIATVSISSGLLVVVVGGLKISIAAHCVSPVLEVAGEEPASPPDQGAAVDARSE